MAASPASPDAAEQEEAAAAAGPEVFAYSPADFVVGGWEAASPFDLALERGWTSRAAQGGLFRYRLGDLQTRRLPGRAGLVAQLNPQRGSERRPAQAAWSVRQGFDPQQFNFTQLRPAEVLFALGRRGSPPPLWVAINASPLERGHVLLLPEPWRGLPQALTAEALGWALEALLLSGRPGFRVGFNSLGGFASVNHLHLHGYYLDWELPGVEASPCQPLRPDAGLHLLRGEGVPAAGFLFYCPADHHAGLAQLARRVCRFTDHLARHEVAHNLFATRGAAPEGGVAGRGARPGLRVVLWPRRACFGAKESDAFNVALCELAGHLPVKRADDFQALTEDAALRLVRRHLLPQQHFERLQQELLDLLPD